MPLTAPTDLTTAPTASTALQQAPTLAEAMGEATRLHSQGQGRSATLNAHASDWHVFATWCASVDLQPLPAEPGTVGAFIGAEVQRKRAPATIRRRLATIAVHHRQHGHHSPCSHDAVLAIMRGLADDPVAAAQGRGGAAPLVTEDVLAMVQGLPDTLTGWRDRALILLGFASGLRRSELVGLQVSTVVFERRGLIIQLGRTKTTTALEGREVTVGLGQGETCPVAALRRWMEAACIVDGHLFRSVNRWGTVGTSGLTDRAACTIIQAAAERAGLPPDHVSAHSLRAGHVTQRRVHGEEAATIQDTTGHTSDKMIRHYDRAAKRFRKNTTTALGL